MLKDWEVNKARSSGWLFLEYLNLLSCGFES
jgi:hypothetical protein